jgi:DNA (cytosine-5)-methyltransferase 1
MTTVGQVEIDPYCQRVLARHWPEVPRHDDVLTAPMVGRASPDPIDVVCGGFPCQPFSLAGKQLGTNDERWMWPATATVIRAVGPRYVLLENVSALVRDSGAFGAVLGDLHALGFDAEWATLRASDFGAPTPRERVYVLAYPASVDGQSRDRVGAGRVGGSPIAARGLRGLDVAARREPRVRGLQLNPEWTDWLMGFPPNHTACESRQRRGPAVAEHIGRLIVVLGRRRHRRQVQGPVRLPARAAARPPPHRPRPQVGGLRGPQRVLPRRRPLRLRAPAEPLQQRAAAPRVDADPAFVFVVVEKDAPYLVNVGQFANEGDVRLSAAALDKALRLYRDCTATDRWPGWSGVTHLSLPNWHLYDLRR